MAGILTRMTTRTTILGLMMALGVTAPAVAAGLPGEAVFQTHCALCHKATANGRGIGPSLFGVVGRTSGTLPGYAYSKAMQTAALAWTPGQLRSYIAAPRTVVPGNKMTYAGKTSPQQLDDLVAYLETLK